MRSLLNNDDGYANALAGVAFEKAAWVSDPATASWSALCTTDGTGSCTSASLANGRYLVRQVALGAPSGWRALTRLAWGGSSAGASPARDYVGDVNVSNGSSATVRPSTAWSPTAASSTSGRFVVAKNNPPLPARCGLDVLLLLDRSGSITSQRDTYKAAAQQLVTTLSGTPTRLKIYSFAESASANQSAFLNLDTPADVATANSVINAVYAGTGGATNWDAGMKLAAGAAVDTVLFVTDGNPTYRDSSTSSANDDGGTTVNLLDLTAGIASANKVKAEGKSGGPLLAAGATILGVGSGSGITASNLAAVSGPVEGTDYVTSSVSGLGAELQRIANQLCGARIHVRKLTDDPDAAVAKAGWDIAAGKPGGSPVSFTPGALTTTGDPADDVINVDKIPAAGATSITVSETQKTGYAFVASACQKDSFATPGSGGSTTATIATLRRTEDWYCTFRNSHSGRLIVKKQTLPDGDPESFGFTTNATGAGTFSLGDDGTESRAVTPGTYTATEAAEAGWALSGLTCDDANSTGDTTAGTATFRIAAGETVTCTFTNTKNGRLIVEKQTLPNGDPASFAFTTTATGLGTFSLTDGGLESRAVVPGTYTATETAKADWNLTGLTCNDANSTGDTTAGTATFRIAAGETVTCTFTNTKNGRLIVEKQTLPNGDPASFAFTTTATGAGTFSLTDGGTESRSVVPGTYTATETAKTDWALTGLTCNDANSTGDGTARTATFRVAAGEIVTCTFTNTKNGRLIVEKQTLPNGDPSAFAFTTTATGAGTFSLTDGGTESRSVVPGTYTATETAKADWALSGLACDDADSTTSQATRTASFHVAAGETVTCTFTNTKNGRLIVEKQTLPNGDPASFAFTTTATGAGTFSLVDGATESRSVAPGTYTATESSKADWNLTGLTCDDTNSTGDTTAGTATYRVAPGETVTCTFTNTKNGRIVVAQQTLPDGDPATFDFTSGSDSFSLADDATNSRPVSPGTYSATQDAKAAWNLTGLTCDDADSTTDKPAGAATFQVAPGETVTCTFTNTKNGRLIVEKHTLPAGDPTQFDFATDATGVRSFKLADGGSESRSVAPGSYAVTEARTSGYRLTGVSCTDADSLTDVATRTASYAIAPGETVTCSFTNQLVTVQPVVVKAGPEYAYHGDTLSFTFQVTNPAGGDLTSVQVSDDRCAPVNVSSRRDSGGAPDATPAVLNIGDVWVYECSMAAPAHTAGEPNPTVNTVTVTAVDEFDRPVSDTDQHSTRILHPAIDIEKSGPATAQAGDAVTYGLDVTNPGDVPFLAANVNVGDVRCEAPPALTTTNGDVTPGQLDPGDRWSYTCLVRTAVGETQVVNVGVVTAKDSFGGHVVTDDDQVVTVLTAPPVVTPTPTPPAAAAAAPTAKAPARSGVLAATDESGSARLSGPSSCVRGPFRATVTGSKIRQVTFTVGGKRRGTVKAKSGRKAFSLRIDPRHQGFGVIKVSAKVSFTAASATKARTLRLVYQRCPKSAVLPQFTG